MMKQTARLQRWILTEGRRARTVPDLLDAFAQRLREDAPVDRIWCGTKLLHPQAAAYVWIWEAQRPPIARELSYSLFAKLRQGDSPVRRLERGAESVRFQRGDGDETADVTSLWERDFTDMMGLSLFLRGQWAGGVTWATKHPDGFSAEHLAMFTEIMPALSAVIEPIASDLVMGTLLRTYLGRDAGARVHDGAVQRGDGTTLRAVVWFSDVRGFTRLSGELERDRLLDLLNDSFEQVVGALEAQGGQVLKFMGDGLLAVFAETTDDPTGADVCQAARAAAVDLQQRLADLRERREARGLVSADVGVGLHFGDVSYGNIGAPARLDFTVIGPAVNLAARVEGLCGKLVQPVLATQDFVTRDGGAWDSCGVMPVKGVSAPVEVYRPA
jgi:adenylate cyclase